MKKKILTLIIGSAALAFAGCESTGNTNTANTNLRNANSNTAYVVNNNGNTTVVSTTNTNSNRWNPKITKEEYEKNRGEYEKGKRNDTWGQSIEDSWLWFKVRSALATTSDIRESTIDVDVNKDVVTLKGTVETAAQKTKAGEVAKVDGVTKVNNELKVAPADSMTNTKDADNKKSSNTATNKK